MSASVTLFSDRPSFEKNWRLALSPLGIDVHVLPPTDLASELEKVTAAILDATSESYDEDELLASVGLSRASGTTTAVYLPRTIALANLDDVLDEVCAGLVARSDDDIPRIAQAVARRLDAQRASRFEYVSVSPRGSDLLVILGHGQATELPRPACADDDGGEITAIELSADASVATLSLASGKSFQLRANEILKSAGLVLASSSLVPSNTTSVVPANGSAMHGLAQLDGIALGARLRKLRTAAGLTQAELARRTGIHRPNIARVEAGRHTPSLETLGRLAAAIGVSAMQVLSEE